MSEEIPQCDPDEHDETSHYARCKWCGTLDPTEWAVVVGPDGEIKEIECKTCGGTGWERGQEAEHV